MMHRNNTVAGNTWAFACRASKKDGNYTLYRYESHFTALWETAQEACNDWIKRLFQRGLFVYHLQYFLNHLGYHSVTGYDRQVSLLFIQLSALVHQLS